MSNDIINFIFYCCNQDSLEYKWKCRNLDIDSIKNENLKELIKNICLGSFNYQNLNCMRLNNDKSLKIVSNICNCSDTALSTVCNQYNIKELGEYFNSVAGSGREVKHCYDCGTVARAIFLTMVSSFKGGLTEEDKLSIRSLYNPDRLKPSESIEEFYNVVKSVKGHCIFMVSIGLDNFGHIWIIEKFRNGKYTMYQSALGSYLLMDYLEYRDSANNNEWLNIHTFYKAMKYLINYKGPWTNEENTLFCKWFQFMPTSPVTKVKSFLYCYVCLEK
jgi:hypothetical protein